MPTQKIQQSAQAYAVVDHAHLSKSENTEYFFHPISGKLQCQLATWRNSMTCNRTEKSSFSLDLPMHLVLSMIAVLMRQGLCEVGGHGSLASPNKCQLPERCRSCAQRSRCNTDVMNHRLWHGLQMLRTACVCAGYNMVICSSTACSSVHLQHGHLVIYSMVICSSTAWSSVH